MNRRMAAGLLVAGLLALLAALGLATAATAHAVLERSDPVDGAVVPVPPAQVTLTFGEDVTLVPDAVRVYDGALHRVDLGVAGHRDGDAHTAAVGLPADLAAGTYSVTWRVVSADSHPVAGGLRFSVGHPGPVGVAPPAADAGGSGPAGVVLALARFLEYAGLAGLGGAVVAGWARTAGDPGGAGWRVPVTGWSALLVGTALAFLAQGPDAQGLGLGSVADPAVLATTLASPVGRLAVLRVLALLVLAAAGVALRRGPGRRPSARRAAAGVAGAAALGVVLTIALGGHAGVGSWAVVGVVADVAHMVAMALWIGGLATLAASVASRRPAAATTGALAAVLPRFSVLAQVAVGVVVVTGSIASWRFVGEPGALVATTYGWLLLAKVALVAGVVGLGNRARVALRRPGPPAVGTLRRGLLAEAGLAVAVLAVTSVLVATPQAAETYAPALTDTQQAGGLTLDARVDAAHTGATVLHLGGTDAAGRPVPLRLVSGAASLPDEGLGPLPLTGPVDALPVTFPVPGRWALDVTVAAPGDTPTLFRITVPVR